VIDSKSILPVSVCVCSGASGDTAASPSPVLASASERQEEEWKTELARVCD